jgi:diguanylate cyclase (GGDEF)-like protein
MVDEHTVTGVLVDFAQAMLTDSPIQSILDRLVVRIVDVLPVDGAGVTLMAPGMEPDYLAASDEVSLRMERLQALLGGPCRTAYETDSSVSITDLAEGGAYQRFRAAATTLGIRSLVSFPLRHGEVRLGTLDLYSAEPGELSDEDVESAETLAYVVAVHVLNARLRHEAVTAAQRFRESSLHDPLTGVANRTLLSERLEHAAQRSGRTQKVTAVVFLDLDRFKQVNDTYGHPTGDRLLVAVADRLAALVRPGDTLARVSGDEFVILCEDVDVAADVEALKARIERGFCEPFDLGAVKLAVTASLGVAYAQPGEPVGAELVADADTEMYEAKRKAKSAARRTIDLGRNAPTSHGSAG